MRSNLFSPFAPQDGEALEHASEDLKGDRELVMQAIAQNGHALVFASDRLKGDREIVMQALAQNGWALRHALRRAERRSGDCNASDCRD